MQLTSLKMDYHLVRGPLDLAGGIELIKGFSARSDRHDRVIWDFRQTSTNDLNADEVLQLVDAAKQFADQVKGRKVAFIVQEGVDMGVANIFQSLSLDLPFALDVFLGLDDALAWLADQD